MKETKKTVINFKEAGERIKKNKKEEEKKQKEKQKNRRFEPSKRSNGSIKDKVLYGIQFILFIFVTIIMLRKCGYM